MCPDRELLSAFFDGEVENPWKDELEAHLKECENCRGIISSFRHLCLVLQEDREPACAAAKLRTLERILQGPQILELEKTPLWRKRLQVPFPLVAAAASLLVAFGMFFTFNLGKSSSKLNPQLADAGSTPAVAEILNSDPSRSDPTRLIGLHDDDLDTILRLIEDREYTNEVIIRLPEDSDFFMFGEPKFIRAKDLNGSN